MCSHFVAICCHLITHITHHSQPEVIIGRDGWLLSAVQTDGVDFAGIYVAPSALKEQPKPKGGGSGNLRQSSIHEIQQAFGKPVALTLDNGISGWEEGVMQAPALRGKHWLRFIQGAVWSRLVGVSGAIGEQHKELVSLQLAQCAHDEALADQKADQRLCKKSESDVSRCTSKVAELKGKMTNASDIDELEALESEYVGAKARVEEAKARLKDAQKRSDHSRSSAVPKTDPKRLKKLRCALAKHAIEATELSTLACLAFGEGAGPERFTLVASNRRLDLVRILEMCTHHCKHHHAMSHVVCPD